MKMSGKIIDNVGLIIGKYYPIKVNENVVQMEFLGLKDNYNVFLYREEMKTIEIHKSADQEIDSYSEDETTTYKLLDNNNYLNYDIIYQGDANFYVTISKGGLSTSFNASLINQIEYEMKNCGWIK